jgi:hypothetical protein
VSRFLCLSFFAAAKKVSAAPHRGNTNRPLTIQGKAKTIKTQRKQTTQKNKQKPTPQANRQPKRRAGKKKS